MKKVFGALKMKRIIGGHPAKRDPEIAKLYKAMMTAVGSVRDLEGRLSDEAFLHLRASALGLMVAYSELTGLPSPYNAVLNFEKKL